MRGKEMRKRKEGKYVRRKKKVRKEMVKKR